MPEINLDNAAYHCQQAAEKSVKALLVHLNIAYPRKRGEGHDIDIVVRLFPSDYSLRRNAEKLIALTPWATAFRYPSDDDDTESVTPDDKELERWRKIIADFIGEIATEITNPNV